MGKGRQLTYRHPDRADHHPDQSILWISFATFGCHTSSIVLLQLRGDDEGKCQADPDGYECQTDTAVVPAVIATKDNWVAEKERVLKAKVRITHSQCNTNAAYEKTVDQSDVE